VHMQAAYDLWHARKTLKRVAAKIEPLELAD
jgi:plasmid maintenance system antidote protein VapI